MRHYLRDRRGGCTRTTRRRSGQYRVIYALVLRGFIHVLHAFKKTTQATPQRSIAVAKRRLQEVIA